MNNEFESSTLRHLLKEVEMLVGWGAGETWTTQDFADLSTKIFARTGVVLSVTTLKRVWGKVSYHSKPAAGTLNALAQYIGHENWQAYLQKYRTLADNEPTARYVEEQFGKRNTIAARFSRFVWPTVIIAGIILGTFLVVKLYFRTEEASNQVPEGAFRFESKMMEVDGIPNTVIFSYDASSANSEDTIHIQQSWDERLREQVSRLDQTHRSVYYYPGFFQAKLLVNNKIVEEQPLYIKTKGWLPLVEQEGSPVYFDLKAAYDHPGELRLPVGKIEEKNIALQPKTPWVSYYYVREFGNLKTDNFVFSTRIKNEYNEGAAICQHAEIHLLFEGGAFVIPLAIKGCVGDLMFFDVEGSIGDTEALGCNLSEWVDVEFKVQDRKGVLNLNNRLAYDQLNFDLPPLALVGIRFRFQGTGSVDQVTLSNINGALVYHDDFEQPLSVHPEK